MKTNEKEAGGGQTAPLMFLRHGLMLAALALLCLCQTNLHAAAPEGEAPPPARECILTGESHEIGESQGSVPSALGIHSGKEPDQARNLFGSIVSQDVKKTNRLCSHVQGSTGPPAHPNSCHKTVLRCLSLTAV